MIRRPPRSTLDRSSAASDVYKRQEEVGRSDTLFVEFDVIGGRFFAVAARRDACLHAPVSYTHLRAHETVLDLVCRLLLEHKTTTGDHTPVPHPADRLTEYRKRTTSENTVMSTNKT